MKPLDWFGVPSVRSSLGYHLIAPYDYQAYEGAIINAAPAVIKIMADGNDFGRYGNYYNQLKDEALFIARPYLPGEAVNQAASQGGDPYVAAQAWHDAVLPLVPHLPLAYWEVCNEPGADKAEWHGLCHARCVELAHASGFRVVVANWSEGNPMMTKWGDPREDWLSFMPALEAVSAAGPGVALLGIHEYARYQDGGFLTQPWRIGRINGVYEEFIDPRGLTVYTVITEYGRDAPSWKDTPGLTPEVYAQELTDSAVQDLYDARVVGRTIFTCNAEVWQRHNIAGATFDITNAYLVSNKPSVFPPIPSPGDPPPPPPPPPPSNGKKYTTANLYLRDGAGTGYSKITIMPNGTEVFVIEELLGWSKVNVILDANVVATYTDPAQYTTWKKEVVNLTGWCATSYLRSE